MNDDSYIGGCFGGCSCGSYTDDHLIGCPEFSYSHSEWFEEFFRNNTDYPVAAVFDKPNPWAKLSEELRGKPNHSNEPRKRKFSKTGYLNPDNNNPYLSQAQAQDCAELIAL